MTSGPLLIKSHFNYYKQVLGTERDENSNGCIKFWTIGTILIHGVLTIDNKRNVQ